MCDSQLRAGRHQGDQKAFKDEKAEAKAAPFKILPRPQFPLRSPTCQHSRRGYSLWLHLPDLRWLDPWPQLGHLHDLSKGFRTQLRNVHCSGLVSGPASTWNGHLLRREWRTWPFPSILTAFWFPSLVLCEMGFTLWHPWDLLNALDASSKLLCFAYTSGKWIPFTCNHSVLMESESGWPKSQSKIDTRILLSCQTTDLDVHYPRR